MNHCLSPVGFGESIEVPLPRSWHFDQERSQATEAMDRPDLDPLVRQEALEGLARLRLLFLPPDALLEAMVSILPSYADRTLRIVELGAGSTQLSSGLGRALQNAGRRVEMVPTDRVAAPGVRELDCSGSDDWMDADLYFSNLMLHHLGEGELRHSLGMQGIHARFGSIHLDLVRSRLSYYLTRLILPILRYPRINQSDGLLSIQAAFTALELRGLTTGLRGISKVRRIGPFRQLLRCSPATRHSRRQALDAPEKSPDGQRSQDPSSRSTSFRNA